MGSVSEPPGGGILRVRLPVFWEVIFGDVGETLFFCDFCPFEP